MGADTSKFHAPEPLGENTLNLLVARFRCERRDRDRDRDSARCLFVL